ncbi:PAAR domain-containing protein [Pseudomonas viridiflava]|uniref:PAAR motif-containing protein n=1 Tax=Pseudomonas viridiflava TaxID=33069 RepID=A0A3M5P4C8_PSEVI|nr:PAAR domain-containing protein [Pseudomonas viridiflava]MBA1230958.1 PAAR domain-containing protein [Pseudomonas viridiflava]RMT79579.1 PAAR motif-containing protein [Pseudomonas viridiflava]
MPFLVREGDPTTSDGVVLNTSSSVYIDMVRVARMGDPVWCPACDSVGFIAQGNPTYIDELVAVATHGHAVECGCAPGSNRLIASQKKFQADMDAAINLPDELGMKARLRAEGLTHSLQSGTYQLPEIQPSA